jgi:hypothetical protein
MCHPNNDHQALSLHKVKSNTNLILFYSLKQFIPKFENWKCLSLILVQKRRIVNKEDININLSGMYAAAKKSTHVLYFYHSKRKGMDCSMTSNHTHLELPFQNIFCFNVLFI